jgi:proline iminopeptidase
MREFYPELQPYNRGRLRVSELHEIYYEECGNPDGKPVVVLHGGPGGGISPFLRRLHDPKCYRIVLFDQRGCGQSTPNAELRENTTWHLVADIEALRAHLGIATWQVLGGSWGSTLALAYAQTHTERVDELILRGIFTVRQREIKWFYQEGASALFRDDLVVAYHKRLTGNNVVEQLACAKAWSQWEASTLSLRPNPKLVIEFGNDAFALAFGRIECHYFVNRGFFESDDQLLAGAGKLRGLPGVIIQGRYDVVTPAETAWALHKAWPEADFEIIPDAGHTATEPGIADALIRATDRFAMRATHS